MKQKTILLTGWTWFIWSQLLEKLLDLGHKILLIKRADSNTKRIDNILDKNSENISLFNIDEIDIETVFMTHKIDVILHLATCYKKTHSSDDLEEMIDSNIKFPSTLCELASKFGVKYFINTWTFFEYEHKNHEQELLSETTKERAFNLYASTKLAFNEILKYYSQNHDFKVVNLRLFSPYWPKDNEKIIPLLIKSILQKKEIKLSWWEQQLTFTYVEDIVDAYIKSIDFLEQMSTTYEVFNIGGDKTSSIREIISYLKEILWIQLDNVKLWEIPYGKNEIFYSWCDNTKAKTILHRNPQYDIKKWLSLTYDFYKNEIQ